MYICIYVYMYLCSGSLMVRYPVSRKGGQENLMFDCLHVFQTQRRWMNQTKYIKQSYKLYTDVKRYGLTGCHSWNLAGQDSLRNAEICGDCHVPRKMANKYGGDLRRRRILRNTCAESTDPQRRQTRILWDLRKNANRGDIWESSETTFENPQEDLRGIENPLRFAERRRILRSLRRRRIFPLPIDPHLARSRGRAAARRRRNRAPRPCGSLLLLLLVVVVVLLVVVVVSVLVLLVVVYD